MTLKRLLFLFIVSPLVLFSRGPTKNFELLMGKGSSQWKYLETPEDFNRLAFFKTLFEKQISKLEEKTSSTKIPKVIHFISVGPESYSPEMIKQIGKWIDHHPHWKIKFWTDLDRNPPHSRMEKCLLEEFSFQRLGDLYYSSVNFEEKSNILAYEILLKEGGLYVDPHMTPLKAFDPLNEHLDFYCGLEKLAPSMLSTSVFPSSQLIGAKPQHPVLRETISWIESHWDEMERSFPGKSKIATLNRILHRSVWALSEGIAKGVDIEENVDLIFPYSFFNGDRVKLNAFAMQCFDRPLLNFSSESETKIQKQIQEMVKKDDEAVMITLLLAAFSFLGYFFLFIYARKINREG